MISSSNSFPGPASPFDEPRWSSSGSSYTQPSTSPGGLPNAAANSGPASGSGVLCPDSQSNGTAVSHCRDLLETSVAHNARFSVLGQIDSFGTHLKHGASSTPSPRTMTSSRNKYGFVSEQLFSLLPDETTTSILLENGPFMFLGPLDPSSHGQHITVTDHPAVIAKRLMMLALCLQQLPSSFDKSALSFPSPLPPHGSSSGVDSSILIIRLWLDAVYALVTCNDDLVANAEGLEALLLQAVVQADAGHLRKAWMMGRKAISMALLLGIHHPQPSMATLITSCNGDEKVTRETIASLWFRANCIDRYASLVLGLPPSSKDTTFSSEERTRADSTDDRLGKAYAVCAGLIIDRNEQITMGQDGRSLTLTIERELERTFHLMDDMWWRPPSFTGTGSALSNELMVLNLQVRHHLLVVMLQLPYMLNRGGQGDTQYENSCAACKHACRAVVHRFLRFRSTYRSTITGRQIDYAALLSSTTLLQGHIVKRIGIPPKQDDDHLLTDDLELVDRARQTFQDMAISSGDDDKLSTESSEALGELLRYFQNDGEKQSASLIDSLEPNLTMGSDQAMLPNFRLQESLFDTLDPRLVFPMESMYG
jgi:hypothetical protein